MRCNRKQTTPLAPNEEKKSCTAIMKIQEGYSRLLPFFLFLIFLVRIEANSMGVFTIIGHMSYIKNVTFHAKKKILHYVLFDGDH